MPRRPGPERAGGRGTVQATVGGNLQLPKAASCPRDFAIGEFERVSPQLEFPGG